MNPPQTCPECTLIPTQHKCGGCGWSYVCGLCSQRRGVPEGIFRCNLCVPMELSAKNQLMANTVDNIDSNLPTVNDVNVNEAESTEACDFNTGVAAETRNDEGELFDCRVHEPPKRLNKKMGRNAIVSVLLKNLIPLAAVKKKYPV